MKSIRAKKCDGRPECYFGIDECGIGCNKNQLLNATEGGSGEIEEDPAFCSFLVNDMYEYSCKSYQPDFDKDAVNSLTAMKQVSFAFCCIVQNCTLYTKALFIFVRSCEIRCSTYFVMVRYTA